MLRYVLLLVMVGLLSVSAQAQELSTKQMLAEEVVEKSKMMDSLDLITENVLSDTTDYVLSESVMELDRELYVQNATQLLASQFTEEELQALADFYSTPNGISIARKMPYFQAAMGKILENMIVHKSKELSEE